MQLKIDPEFQSLIPPLSPDEYKQLEANIIEDGCMDPLVYWNGTLIDGHNRYRICQAPGMRLQGSLSWLAERKRLTDRSGLRRSGTKPDWKRNG